MTNRLKRVGGCRLSIFQGAMCAMLLMSAGCGADSPSSNGGTAKEAERPPVDSRQSVNLNPPKTDPVGARKQLAGLGISYTVGDFIKAAVNGDRVAVTLFLDAGMDVNTRDHRDYTALVAATTFGHRDLVEMLLARGADPALPSVSLNALTLAVEANEPAIATVFLDGVLKQNQEVKDAALARAVTLDRAEMASLLIDKGASVHQVEKPKGETLVMKAAGRGFDQVLRVLLPSSTNVNAITDAGFAAVDYACSRIKKEFRSKGSITIEDDYTPKRTSQRVQSDPCYKLLVAAGAKPITPSYLGNRSEYLGRELQGALRDTAAAAAAAGGGNVLLHGRAREMITGVLIDLKELGATSTDYLRPLVSSCEAAGRARFTYATTLPSTGPSEEEKLTAKLLTSYQMELWALAETMISNAVVHQDLSPDTMIFDKDETLLMKAVYSGSTNLVGLLVRAGADPKRQSQEGLTAISLAKRLKSAAMITTLGAGVAGTPSASDEKTK